jgi:hypothetical protein
MSMNSFGKLIAEENELVGELILAGENKLAGENTSKCLK